MTIRKMTKISMMMRTVKKTIDFLNRLGYRLITPTQENRDYVESA